MKLIVGLGNPGIIYQHSRHNIGFSVIKALAKDYKAPLKKEKGIPALSSRVKLGAQNVILAMPLTYMNLSGIAVAGLVKKYKIGLKNLLVVLDDLDLEFGRLKISGSGSSAGHRGLESTIAALKSPELSRLRIGIGRPHKGLGASDYVLSPFSKKEKAEVKTTIEKASECCQLWISAGITKSMNIFNRKEA